MERVKVWVPTEKAVSESLVFNCTQIVQAKGQQDNQYEEKHV